MKSDKSSSTDSLAQINHVPDRIPNSAILLLSLAAFGGGISQRVTDALVPRLATEFTVTVSEASWAITAFSIAYGLAQMFYGPVGDRFGKYLVIAYGSLACAVTAALCAMAFDFKLLVAARLVAGGVTAGLIPLSMAWIGDMVPYERRQPVLARFLIGQMLGVSFGIFVGGFTADHLPWQTPFVGLTLLFFSVGIALFLLNRRLPQNARSVGSAQGGMLARTFSELRQVLARPWARVVLLTVFLEGAFVFGPLAFVALHLHRGYGLSLSSAGSLVMVFGFGGLLYATTATLFVRRLGEVGIARFGGYLMAAGLLVTGIAPAWWLALPGCFATGLGFYMLHNTLQLNATQMAPERRGAAVSTFAACHFLGQAAGVGTAGVLVERVGTASVIVAGAASILAVALTFSRRRSRHVA